MTHPVDKGLLEAAVRRACHYLETIDQRSVAPDADAIAGLVRLGGRLPEQGTDPGELLALLDIAQGGADTLDLDGKRTRRAGTDGRRDRGAVARGALRVLTDTWRPGGARTGHDRGGATDRGARRAPPRVGGRSRPVL